MVMSPLLQVTRPDGTCIRITLSDTAGEERFRSIAPLYLADASVIVLCYDVSNTSSFESVDVWAELVRNSRARVDARVVLMGCKCDMDHVVSSSSVEDAVSRCRFDIALETSAATGEGIASFRDYMCEVFPSAPPPVPQAERTRAEWVEGRVELPVADGQASSSGCC
jgi:small GTP-binding protein